MSNPNQKAGNFKKKNFKKGKHIRNEKVIRNIAKQEAAKTIAKKAESKIHDTQQNDIAVDWMGTSFLLFNPNRGTGENQVIGNAANPTHLRLKATLDTVPDDTAPQRVKFRAIVVQYKQDAVGSADLLQAVGVNTTPLSAYDDDHTDEYKVLYDELFLLAPGSETQHISFDVRITSDKLKKVTFGEVSSVFIPVTGNIVLYVYSNIDPAGGSDVPLLDFYSRCYFKDM